MSLKNPRADSLPLIRDFIKTIDREIITRLSDFNIVLPNWKRTRCYHYWSAIRDLNFALLENHIIKLTRLGKSLAQVAKFNRFQKQGELNPKEKQIFKLAFLRYESIKRFLSFFISTGKTFESYNQLKRYGNIVIIKPNPENKKSILLITAAGGEVPLSPTEKRTIMWSLKLWLKDVEVIDEIFLERNTWYSKYLEIHNIPERLFFPIKLDIKDIELKQFRDMLDRIVEKLKSNYIFIPILTYYFCTTYFVTVKGFHSKLCDLYHSDPYRYYLETGSMVGVNESFRRVRNYENYPRVDGYPRSYLIVRK